MHHRSLAAAAAALALLVPIGAACSGDDDGGGVLRTQAPDDGGQQTTTTTTGAGEESETTGTTAGTGSSGGASRDDVPADAALDLSTRTPGGVTLNVTGLRFDGEDIMVDAEFKNGQADYEIYLWQGYPTYDLHLLDDAGQAYNFIQPEDGSSPLSETGTLVLQPGESVSGTFAFRGPLAGRPDRVSLVANLYDNEIGGYSLDAQTEGYYPAFVVPMDLTWS